MQALFRIVRFDRMDQHLFDGPVLNIQVSELDFIDIEVRTTQFHDPSEISLIIGNIQLKLDEPIFINNLFYYRINHDFLSSLLPGDKNAHVHKDLITTDIGGRRIFRIFINEIGLSKIYLKIDSVSSHIANVRVSTSKLSADNYELITLYLISAGYFDSNILYKSLIEGSQDDIRNTLLEALRNLQSKLKEWITLLPLFKQSPITKYMERASIRNYNDAILFDEDSIDWLVNNVEVIKNVNRTNPETDFVIKTRPLKIEAILTNELYQGLDSYENRVIHGFLQVFSQQLSLLSSQIINLQPRTRIDTFRDFLISCFNKLIQEILSHTIHCLQEIHSFFKRELPVLAPLYGFPTKVDGFVKRFHYRKSLEIIDYSRRLFNVNININNFTLEVESFDKLFEIYCFYLIKDTMSNLLGKTEWDVLLAPNNSNKLAGRYILKNGHTTIYLHYENFPDYFRQLSRRAEYNPDFIIGIDNGEEITSIIIDAKYKMYNPQKLQEDLSILTLNYLHKIRPISENNTVIGLFTASLSSRSNNKVSTIFKNEYSVFEGGSNIVFPQIGNIELFPKNLSLQSNPFIPILKMLLNK